jgi:hypothetical protein
MRCIKQCSARKTYPHLNLHPLRLVGECPAKQICSIGGVGVVGKRVGRLLSPGEMDQAREVFLDQKAKDATDLACVTSCRLYNRPAPAQVIKNNS